MKSELTPKQVAQAIGVSEASLKRWCDRGLLPTLRTAGGHRRLPLNGVLQFLRETGRAAVKPEVLGLPSDTGQGEALIARAANQMQEALETGNSELFRQVVFNLYMAGHTGCHICDKAIAPAFVEIGKQWEHQALEVYQERRACEICLRLLHELRAALPQIPEDAPRAIGGTLSGDPYVLPSTMAELVLREGGWNAENHGTGIPADTFCAAIKRIRPRLVWLSVSHIAAMPEFLAQYEHLFECASAHGTAVAVGGHALTSNIRVQMRYSAFCDNFSHLISFAATLKPAHISA